ncbi:flagellar motor switch protein FliM [Flaviflagellibacter deserti]|uniref:Flagellar motor switch protein FliM n=1 Tax=Flaviflagellibacter deserti TaxID=2267266 RepID=A0ABV9Z446_9HYPH
MVATHTDSRTISDKLLDAGGISVDRLPMLHVAFDRMATHCADSLRQMSASPAYFSLSNIESARIGDVLEDYEANAIAAVFHAPEWDSRILVGFDRDFIFSMVEVLFGADGAEPPIDEERPFSNIEINIAQAIFERIAKVLQVSFGSQSESAFKFERIETRMDFAIIGRRNNLSVVAKFLLQALNRGGEMFIIIPQSALSPVRETLSHAMSGDASPRDPRWARQIQSEIQRTEMQVRAILEERLIDLRDVTEFKVGQVLELQATPRSRVKLECRGQPLFWCQLGQSDGSYTVKVDDYIDEDQEFIDDILSR